ncbi:hypothetical protein NP493_465g00008 [Ridgeia piscesae]|uniref:Uncharacterized protein n=1 Tax=Ridgeia piscesae TaxID=27915 RepID=A0AAD9KZZ9_RIDPI|nr:hypothetical protein NP493_465g00008 [Ridgeia piscesae]
MDNDQNGYRRHTLYKPPEKKTCQFFKDGDQHFPGIKVMINPQRYKSLESLQNDLSEKVNGLPFGVRSIYTPRGRDPIQRLDQLQDDGKYVCSTFSNKAKGVDIKHLREVKQWRTTVAKPQSGKRAYSKYLKETEPDSPPPPQPHNAWGHSAGGVPNSTRQPKKITVVKDDEPDNKHVILLNRKTMQSFEDVLGDIRGVFQSPITHMFTLGGKPVKSLSSIIHGPDTFMVSQYEHFVPPTAQSDPGSVNTYMKGRGFPGLNNSFTDRRKRRAKLSHTRGKWNLEIKTSDLPSAGTTATVSVTVYGMSGNSLSIPLGESDGLLFSAGSTDTFKLAVGNIGDVYKIRIAHDNSGEFPGWLVDEVSMLDIHTQEQLVFPCHRWLSRDEDDGEICRELPTTRPRELTLAVVRYDVLITTGDLWNAGTGANVYLTIYGERGDSGIRQMYHANRQEKFQKGQAVTLGNIQRVIIGHDDPTPGNGWYLQKWKNEQWKFRDGNHVMFFSKITQQALKITKTGQVDGTAEEHDREAVFRVVDRKSNFRMFRSTLNKKFHLSLENGKVSGKGNGGTFCEFKIRVLDDRSVNLESAKFHNQMIAIQENGRLSDPRSHGNELAKEFFVYCKGMFRHDGTVMFYTSATQVLITDLNGGLCATGYPGSLAKFRVHKVSNSGVRMFENVARPNKYICFKDTTFDCQGDGNKFCQFQVKKFKGHGYVTLESIVFPGVYLTMLPDGAITEGTDVYDRNSRLYPTVVDFGTPSEMSTPEVLAIESPSLTRSTPLRSDTRNMSAESTFGVGDWKVWITTEEAVSEADEIVLWVYGDEANSGPIILWTGEHNGHSDIGYDMTHKHIQYMQYVMFSSQVNLGGVGKIYKIRLELSSQNPNDKPSWKVKRVKLKDMTKRETLKFNFNCWLSLKNTDAAVMRELPAVRPEQDVLPVVKYQLLVRTGKLTGADTDANVYVVLYGERGDTGRRRLVYSNNPVKFQEDQVDVFEIEAVSLGEVTQCIVSHDGDGIGEGWYLDEILVRDGPDASHEYVFPCCRWLDTGMDDKQISRNLGAVAGDWKVWVTTEEDVSDADEIALWVYGEEGNTGPLVLWSGEQNGKFEAGNTDDFKVSLGGVGKIYKIRLELLSQDVNSKPSWKVKTVKLQDLTTKETLKFTFNCWLSLKHTGAATSRERAAVRPAQDVLPVVKYQVLVRTGELTGADTDANVYVVLYGERGDTGRRRLVYSDNPVKFREGQLDTFEVEAVSLGRVNRCIVSHDGDGSGEGWYLNEILLRHDANASHEYVFPCCRWLDISMDDGQISRALEAIDFRRIPDEDDEPETEGEKNEAGDWKVWVTTEEDVSEADEIALWVYGEEGNTGPLVLWSGDQNGKFQAANTDDFKVKLKDMTTKETLKFDFNLVKYQVLVHTGELTGADTDANVYVVLYGERGDTGRRRLVYSDNPINFREGQVDVFEVEAVSLGRVTKCIVSHDGEGRGEGWYLNEVLIREGLNASHEYVFPCCRWLDTGMDDEQINFRPFSVPGHVYEVYITSGPELKPLAGTFYDHVPRDTVIVIYGDMGKSEQLPLVAGNDGSSSPGNTQYFRVNVKEELGQVFKIRVGLAELPDTAQYWTLDSVRVRDADNDRLYSFELSEQLFSGSQVEAWKEMPVKTLAQGGDEAERKPVEPLTVHNYQVEVYTRDEPNAGTDAEISIIIEGFRGDTGKRRLLMSQNAKKFQPGQMDLFTIEAVDMVSLTKVEVEYEGEGHGKGWFLEKIIVKDSVNADFQYVFNCDRWINVGDADTLTELPLSEKIPGYLYEVYVTSGPELKPLAGTFYDHVPKDTVIVIYGDMGKSEQLPLVAEDDGSSSPGNTQYFKVTLRENIGQVFKIRVGLAELPDTAQYWTLDSVRVRDVDNDRLYSFELSEQLFSGSQVEAWKEMPVKTLAQGGDEAERKPVDPLTVHNYQVEVYTRDEPNAGTDANVSITVEGFRGDTGKRRLLVSQNKRKFQPAQMDLFTIDAVDMVSLTKVVVEYEGDGQGKGWFLEKVIVKDSANPDFQYTFSCDRWINVGDADTMTELPLTEKVPGHLYEVYVTSGPELKPLAGTFYDHVPKDTVIVIYGDMGKSEQLPLVAGDDGSSSPGNTQYFKVKVMENIGQVFKIRVGLAELPDTAQYWTLDSVRVRDADNDRLYSFELSEQLFSGSQVEAWKEMPVKTLAQGGDEEERKPVDPVPVRSYQVEVYTRDEPNAGTDANVSITVDGFRGDTGKRRLLVSQNKRKFQPAQMDLFTIDAVDMVSLTKVVVEYEGDGQGKGWFLEKVIVKDSANPDFQYTFNCHLYEVYVTSGSELEPLAGTFYEHVPKDTVIVIYGDMGRSEQLPLVAEEDGSSSPGNTQYFKVKVMENIGQVFKIRVGLAELPDTAQYWTLDSVRVRDADNDRLYSFELSEQLFSGSQVEAWKEMPVKTLAQGGDEAERKPVEPLPVYEYQVEVYTRDEPNAGTDAEISITIEGFRGDTGKRRLLVSQNDKKFQAAQAS